MFERIEFYAKQLEAIWAKIKNLYMLLKSLLIK